MAQPSVASYFNTRKRGLVQDTKINHVRKVLVLDSKNNGLGNAKANIALSQNILFREDETIQSKPLDELRKKEEDLGVSKIVNKVVSAKSERPVKKAVSRQKKLKEVENNQDIQELFNKMKGNVKETILQPVETEVRHITPPSTPTKQNVLDRMQSQPEGPSLKEIKRKMTRSARLADLKASISRFKEADKRLKEVEEKTADIPDSPKIKNFKTIELEISSPSKVFSPEKAYMSPKKDLTARRNLLNLLSPTKNALPIPESPSKKILETITKPSLTLPFKYRHLAEVFRSIDTVCQILFNRKEVITFKKLKPAVEEMLKRNIYEKHLAQIKTVYPEAFNFTLEKLRSFGDGTKNTHWELVIAPVVDKDHITSEVLLERRRFLFGSLLELTKGYHDEFLKGLNPPMLIEKDKITRWHPEFDIEKVPDIEMSELPQAPQEEKLTTGKDVLDKAREMFNCNTRMEQALERLKAAKEIPKEAQVPEAPVPVLKGIPKALLEKVRQKQAAKALASMTRTADKEKELRIYSRLPEMARLTRNLFVSEKKSVLHLEIVVEKLGHSHREHLTKAQIEEHLRLLAQETSGWLVLHNIRNAVYVKISKDADLSLVLDKLETLVKSKSEI